MPAEPDPGKQAEAKTRDNISKEAVLAALEKVVASESFGKAERPARFLRHLVQTTLRGEGHVLKESVLGTEVFDRPASWDPRLDPVVRQEAARLRKRLVRYHENGGATAEIRIELPVGSYVPVFRRKQELPPEVETKAIERVSRNRSRIWLSVTAGALCLAGAFIAGRSFFHRQIPTSIVVLPFANLSSDQSNQYFSEGLTDEVTDSLAKLKGLRVVARSSAAQFKGKAVDIREVGRLLNVTDVLEGSVERFGDRVKIIGRLERVSDGSLVWSNTYERKTSDLFAIQSELAAGIAGNLKVAAGAPAPVHVPNALAHDFFMKGRYDLQKVTPESIMQAESDFQRAIDNDPRYGAAYVGLASAKYDQSIARGSSTQTQPELKDVEKLLLKALEFEPDLPQAHSILAVLAMQYDLDWGRAERELELAASGAPSAGVDRDYGFFLLYHGRFADADRHFARMEDLDPFSAQTQSNLSLARMLEGRFSEAREIAQRAASATPGMLWTQQIIGLAYVEEGRPELALPIFRELEKRFSPAKVCEAMALAKAGRRSEALQSIRPFEGNYLHSGISAEWLALVYAFLGDEPNTLKWLSRSADLHETQVLSLAVDPAFARMRNSPGFLALETRIGLNPIHNPMLH